jgi:hypothetical protein
MFVFQDGSVSLRFIHGEIIPRTLLQAGTCIAAVLVQSQTNRDRGFAPDGRLEQVQLWVKRSLARLTAD